MVIRDRGVAVPTAFVHLLGVPQGKPMSKIAAQTISERFENDWPYQFQ